MIKKSTISKVFALGIMLVLSISMLPQNTLHEWLGCHKDRTTTLAGAKEQSQVCKNTLHCSCDQPEFQSPFIISSFHSTSAYKVFLPKDSESFQVFHYCTTVQSADERGPPIQFFG